MRLERLDLIAFGGFTDRSLDLSAGPRRLHLVYGPNESGKSTTLRAITGLLYNIDAKTPDSYLHSMPSLRVGGRLCADDGTELECVRRKGTRNTLLTPAGEALEETELARLLNGIDCETFERQFGLTHPRLVEGGHAISHGGGDLGEILFAAGAGLGRLNGVEQHLLKEQQALFKPSGTKPSINKQLAELTQLRKTLKQSLLKPADYKRRVQALEQVQQQTQDLRSQSLELKRRTDRHRKLLDALPLLAKRQRLRAQLDEMGSVPRLNSVFVEKRRDADKTRTVADKQLEDRRTRWQRLQAQIAELPAGDLYLKHRHQISELNEQLGASKKASRDLEGLKTEAATIRRQIEDGLQQVAQGKDIDDLSDLRIPTERREIIDALSERVGGLDEKQRSAERALRELEQQVQQLEQDLQQQSVPDDPESLAVVLERIGPPQALVEAQAEADKRLTTLRQRAERDVRRLHGFRGTVKEAMQLTPPSQAKVDAIVSLLDQSKAAQQRTAEQLETLNEKYEATREELDALKRAQSIPSEAELVDARRQRDQQLDQLADPTAANAVDLDAIKQAVAAADSLVDRLRREAERVTRRARYEVEQESLQHKIESLTETQLDAVDQYNDAWQQWLELWRESNIHADQPEVMAEWMAAFEKLTQAYEDLCDAERTADLANAKVAEAAGWLERELQLGKRLAGTATGSETQRTLTPSDDNDQEQSLFDSLEDRWASEISELTNQDADSLDECFGERGENEDPGEADRTTGSSGPDLVLLATAARKRLDAMRKTYTEYQQSQQNLRQRQERLPAAQRELAQQQALYAQWQADWKQATAGLTQSKNVPPRGVSRLIKQIDEVLARKSNLDSVELRIASIGREAESFAEEVNELLKIVANDLLGQPPEKSVPELLTRLSTQQAVEEQRNALTKQCDETADQLEALQHKFDEATTELRLLAQEAGCEDVEQLPELERKSELHTQLAAEAKSLDEKLMMLAGDTALEQFVAEAEAVDQQALQERVDAETAELVEVEQTLTEQLQELGRLRKDVESMDGSAAAAATQQQIQDSLARIRRDAVQYATLRVADVALHAAIERYRSANQGPVLARAERIFARLTLGDYSGLQADYDDRGTPSLVGLRGTTPVPVNRMSDGAADALFLALRLASLETHVDRRGPFPFVLDDILIQLDDSRAAAALEVLSELSEKTQIIFFTHHQHLLEIAATKLKKDEYHTHQLT